MDQTPLSSELRNSLQNNLGASYTIERELGGGGMSRVFVAEEERFGRRVEYYAQFVKLWERADPELQPQVADARRRIDRLAAAERATR